jgi:ABC-type Fe3+-hydroxamate transport system substrate-binding protein
VIAQDPDVIIRIESIDELGWNSSEDPEAIEEEILNRPGAGNISAIKNGRIYICYGDMFFGMDSVVGLTYLVVDAK